MHSGVPELSEPAERAHSGVPAHSVIAEHPGVRKHSEQAERNTKKEKTKRRHSDAGRKAKQEKILKEKDELPSTEPRRLLPHVTQQVQVAIEGTHSESAERNTKKEKKKKEKDELAHTEPQRLLPHVTQQIQVATGRLWRCRPAALPENKVEPVESDGVASLASVAIGDQPMHAETVGPDACIHPAPVVPQERAPMIPKAKAKARQRKTRSSDKRRHMRKQKEKLASNAGN